MVKPILPSSSVPLSCAERTDSITSSTGSALVHEYDSDSSSKSNYEMRRICYGSELTLLQSKSRAGKSKPETAGGGNVPTSPAIVMPSTAMQQRLRVNNDGESEINVGSLGESFPVTKATSIAQSSRAPTSSNSGSFSFQADLTAPARKEATGTPSKDDLKAGQPRAQQAPDLAPRKTVRNPSRSPIRRDVKCYEMTTHFPDGTMWPDKEPMLEIGSRMPPKKLSKSNASNLPSVSANVTAETGGEKKVVSRLWQKLKNIATQKLPVFLKSGTVEDNGSHLPCVANTCVKVEVNGKTVPIHANHVKFSNYNKPVAVNATNATGLQPPNLPVDRKNTINSTDSAYVVGQSPLKFEACEQLLMHAIASQEGVFQILSHRVHSESVHSQFKGQAPGSSINSVISQLISKNPQVLGDRYEIVSIQEKHMEENSACQMLTVRDKKANTEIKIPLTQIGVPYDQGLLNSEHIKEAYRGFRNHMDINLKINRFRNSEPIVISQNGIGRNATLILFHDIVQKMDRREVTSASELEIALEMAIAAGRAARGPDFMPSSKQLQVLHSLLTETMTAANAAYAADELAQSPTRLPQ